MEKKRKNPIIYIVLAIVLILIVLFSFKTVQSRKENNSINFDLISPETISNDLEEAVEFAE